MKWQDSAASRLRQRQNRTFATRASAAAGGSAAAAAAAAAMALGAGGGGREGRGRRNRSRRREAVVVAGGLLAIEEEEYDDVVGRIDDNNNTAGLSHSYGSFFERAENAAAAAQQQQQQQPSRRRRLRNGGSIISTSVTKTAATAATTTEAAPGTSSDAIMTLPPPFARNRPPRRSSMPSSFGGAGPTLVQMQAAFLTQRLQQHRERQQEQHGTSSSMMPPPMPREAKRRRSISTEFNLDVDDESGRSTPRRSNSSGGSVSASVSATSTSRAVSNPFAVDLDGPSEFLTEDLLQRTCLPQPGQVGFAEHMAGLFFKDVAASASPGPSAGSRRTFTFSRRMSLPSPQDMSRRAQMTGGGDGGLHHHSSAAAAGLGSNREMMQILRAQHQQLQMQWQAQAEAQAEAEAESRAQQEGTASATTFRRRQQRRSELFTSPGGSSTGTASGSTGINFSPTSTVAPTSTSNGVRVPPPFAFKYSLSDRSLGTGGSVADAATTATAAAADASCTAATEGGLQRFKKRPSESIYANNEVEMTDASSSHPQGGTEGDDVVCTEIHSTTSGTAEQPPSSRAAGVAAAAVSVRPTTDTSATSSSSHSISPPSHEEIAAANATVKAPAIRFFNNGVEVNETGVPIVSPAVPAKPLAHPVKIPFSSQAQRHVTNEETDDGNEGDVTASTSSPYFTANKNTANEDEASLSPPLSRSCSVTDVISFAVKRVPELSTRMTLPSTDEADSTKIDDVLKALYDIASDAKSEASPKAPAETDAVEAQQVRQTELLQARLSTTIRSVEGYRRGKAIQVADEKAPMGPDCQATTAKATTAAAVGPHADLINKIFGGGGQQKRRSGTTGRTTRPGVERPALEESSGSESTLGESNSSLDDMVRDSFAQREKHVDAATALLGLGGGSCSD